MSIYLMGYGIGVFCMEFIRLDSQKILGSSFSIEHIVAAVLFLFGLIVLLDRIHKYQVTAKAQPKMLPSKKTK